MQYELVNNFVWFLKYVKLKIVSNEGVTFYDLSSLKNPRDTRKNEIQTKTRTVILRKWVWSTCQKTFLKVQIFARELLPRFSTCYGDFKWNFTKTLCVQKITWQKYFVISVGHNYMRTMISVYYQKYGFWLLASLYVFEICSLMVIWKFFFFKYKYYSSYL